MKQHLFYGIFAGVVAAGLGIAYLNHAPPKAAEPLAGPAKVIDGDTIIISGVHIRLHGIDAPERAQTCEGRAGEVYECGRDAAAVMQELVGGWLVECEPEPKHDRYNRVVATCHTDKGDIAAAMVRRGWAVAYVRYGGNRYLPNQIAAQNEHLGIWSGRFEMPAEWRKEHR